MSYKCFRCKKNKAVVMLRSRTDLHPYCFDCYEKVIAGRIMKKLNKEKKNKL